MTLRVVELAFSVHLAVLPVSDINMPYLVAQVRIVARFRPNELSVTVELSIVQVSSIFRTISKHKVTVTLLAVKVPLPSVP